MKLILNCRDRLFNGVKNNVYSVLDLKKFWFLHKKSENNEDIIIKQNRKFSIQEQKLVWETIKWIYIQSKCVHASPTELINLLHR